MDLKIHYYCRLSLPGISKQTLRIMKLIAVILFAACIQVSARGYSQITLSETNAPLQKIFQKIQQQSGYDFVSTYETLKEAGTVTIKVRNVSLQKALEECLKGKPLTYIIIGKTVVIQFNEKYYNNARNVSDIIVSEKLPPPPINITGKVVNAEGNPIQGVSVILKGTKTGATTDSEGMYSITIPNNGVLVFSNIGYIEQEIPTSGKSVINISMTLSATSMDQIVVVGYGSQRKGDITGSIVSVDVDELNKVPAPNLAQQLQGRSSGVSVTSDNTPGGEPTIRIRGFGTINNNDPLYIIDGVPTKGGLNNINPNNIESIQILKDASAASIYGSRASNGVIIITTIKGKTGQSKLTFDARYGVQVPKNNGHADVILDPQKFGELKWKQLRNAQQLTNGNPVDPQYGNGTNPVVPDYILAGNKYGVFEGDPATNPELYNFSEENMYQITRANKQGTNWLKEILSPAAPTMEFNLGSSGGSDKGKYAFGINYFNKEGSLHFTSFKRFSVRANSEFVIKNKVRVGENLEVGQSENLGFFSTNNVNNDDGNPVGNAYRMPSIVPVYDIMGHYAGTRANGLSSAQNPVGQLDRGKNNSSKNTKVFGNLYAEVDLIKNLTARTSLGFDYQNNDLTTYDLLNLEAAAPIGFNGLLNAKATEMSTTWSNTLNYKFTTGDIHDFQVLVGSEAIQSSQRAFNASRQGFISEDPAFMFLNAGSLSLNNGGSGYEWSLFSLFGKVNYKLKDRYLFQATVRRDGSSRFGQNNRYGLFPAFSAGWRISEESFLEPVKWIQNLNLRGSWGLTGNQEIGNYNGYTTYRTSLSNSSYDMTGSNTSVIAGFDTEAYGNPNTKWETAAQTDFGVDATFFNGKLGFSFDWFDRATSNMLYQVPLPATQGQAIAPFVNVGSMRNRGIDLELSFHSRNSSTDKVSYDISANFSTYKNKVVSLSGNRNEALIAPEIRNFSYARSAEGLPIFSFYGLQIEGIFQNEKEVQEHAPYAGYAEVVNGRTVGVGKFIYRDVNKDGIINDQDRTWIGNPHPDFTYGVNINVGYKNFDLTMFFQGVQGNDLVNYVRRLIDFNELGNNRSMRMLTQSWTPENSKAVLPILDASDSRSLLPSSYFVEDGSYLRMKTLQVGYNLSPGVLSRVKLERVRLYVQANNLFTITNYSGLDPEINFTGSGIASQMGIDRGLYPGSTIYQAGLSIGL
jgi:TonB-linked SusC/RagA family outer membrane protein